MIWILAQFTGDRYRPEFQWSSSWVYNLFRVYELIFGRKYGIRKESSAATRENGVYREFFTLEAFLVYLENEIKEFFKKPKLIKVSQLQFAMPANTAELQIPWISFAIALDTGNNGASDSGTTNTFSFTCTGSNLLLWVMPASDSSSDTISSVTYNTVGMTQSPNGNIDCPFGGWQYLYYLAAPATGAHNVVSTWSGSVGSDVIAVSYSGCGQTGIPDNSAKVTEIVADGSRELSLTTVADNCWTLAAGQVNTGTPGVGVGTTLRASCNRTLALVLGDSNGVIHPAGSNTLEITSTTLAVSIAIIMVSFAPPASTSISKVDSVVYASISKVTNVALASISKVLGVS